MNEYLYVIFDALLISSSTWSPRVLLLELTTKGYTTDLQLPVVTWTLQTCQIHWPTQHFQLPFSTDWT